MGGEVLNHMVMADRTRWRPRMLADTYEQLGYGPVCTLAQLLSDAALSCEKVFESRSYAANAGMAAGIPVENRRCVRLLPEAATEDMRLYLQFNDLKHGPIGLNTLCWCFNCTSEVQLTLALQSRTAKN